VKRLIELVQTKMLSSIHPFFACLFSAIYTFTIQLCVIRYRTVQEQYRPKLSVRVGANHSSGQKFEPKQPPDCWHPLKVNQNWFHPYPCKYAVWHMKKKALNWAVCIKNIGFQNSLPKVIRYRHHLTFTSFDWQPALLHCFAKKFHQILVVCEQNINHYC